MSTTPRARRSRGLLLGMAAASVTALVATTLSTPAQAAPAGSSGPSAGASSSRELVNAGDRTSKAKKALVRAQKALDPVDGKERNATLALRKLWLLKDSLSPADRAVADKLAARPSKPSSLTDGNITLHYDQSELGYDVNAAWASAQYVANTYAGSGYRRPLKDGSIGGDGTTDIYLDNLEPGLYGYCTTDQKRFKPRSHAVWAYCVIDADFANFPRTPLENFQVTMAHEYFHATQFAYDFREDGWLLESTAAWAEDELYPAINDNFQYLKDSPITKPGKSIDKFGGLFHYGVWNFWRYLTEKYPTKVGALPGLVLDVWNAADSSKGPRKDKYSLQATNKALKKNGKTSLAEQFSLYSAATRATHQTFAEGAALNYPVKPLGGSAALGPAAKKKKSFKTRLDHLTSDTFAFTPAGTAPGAQLKIKLKMAGKRFGSRAVVVTYGPTGAITSVTQVKVNPRGVGSKKFAFDAGTSSVEVTLVNASQKFRNCYRRQTPYSCSGTPVDQNERAVVQAKVA